MEDIRDILRIPNREVVSVTKVLTGVDLKKILINVQKKRF